MHRASARPPAAGANRTIPERRPASAAQPLAELAARYALDHGQQRALAGLLELLVTDPAAPTTIRSPTDVVSVHLADSLSALGLSELDEPESIADLGSGAGLPGLPLAIARPRAVVTLVESTARKCAFLERAVDAAGVDNARIANTRAESWAAGLGRHDLVTARALAPLAVLCEYAAPLLRRGGALVAWKGRLDAAELEHGDRAAAALGLEPARRTRSDPYPGSAEHQLVVFRKVADTPDRFPRRPGVARKRPLGGPPRPS